MIKLKKNGCLKGEIKKQKKTQHYSNEKCFEMWLQRFNHSLIFC